MGSSNTYGCLVRICIALVFSLSIAGCSSLKRAAMIGGAAGLGATAGTVISTGVIAPIAGAAIGASVADVVVTGLEPEPVLQTTEIIADTVVNEAPDNFFTLIQKLTEMGGWLLILIFVVPMVIGWIIPGPLQKVKKKR